MTPFICVCEKWGSLSMAGLQRWDASGLIGECFVFILCGLIYAMARLFTYIWIWPIYSFCGYFSYSLNLVDFVVHYKWVP